MLLVTSSLMSQVQTEKHRNGRIARQYTLNKNGDYIGSYKEFDNQGRCLVSYNYNSKGEKTGEWIDYAYQNKPAKIIKYSTTGGILLSEVKYEYDLTVTPMKQVMTYKMICDKNGEKLEEWLYEFGRGLFKYYEKTQKGKSFRAAEDFSIYLEQYNGNDTVYAWHDFERTESKQHFAGKRLNSDWIIKYDKEGNVMYDKIAIERERFLKDSIVTANKLAEELRIKEERQAREDTIANLKQNYENALELYIKNDSLYIDALNKYVVDKNEQTLYLFLHNYLTKKKKKQHEIQLQQMIIDLETYDKYKNANTKTNGKNLKSDVGRKLSNVEHNMRRNYSYPSDNMTAEEFRYAKELAEYNGIKEAYIIEEQHQCIFDKQAKLIAIMEYCDKNKIVIK
jgi:hypothetical protein